MLLAPAAYADDADSSDAEPQPPARCVAPSTLKGELLQAWAPACEFFSGIADRDIGLMTAKLHAPFYFEGRSVAGADEVRKKWRELLADLGSAPEPFYGLELYTYDDMVKKYGKPPAKLDSVPLRGAIIAVANIDGHPEIAALKRENGAWAIFAFHD